MTKVPNSMTDEEKTIIGFMFPGYDFGNLWLKLTDD